ncbi:MAG TPA: CpsD/CapB family tyrosine-protein kinase [Acidimicrobiia bacterium]
MIAVIVAAVVAIAWITTPASKKGAKGSVTFQAQQTAYVDGGRVSSQSLQRMASYLVAGRVPQNVANELNVKLVEGADSTSGTKGASGHVVIGAATVVAKPVTSIAALNITATGKSATFVRQVVDDETIELQKYLNATVSKDHDDQVTTLQNHTNQVAHTVEQAYIAEGKCAKGDKTCAIETRATAKDQQGVYDDLRKQLNKLKRTITAGSTLRPAETNATGSPNATLSRKVHSGSSTIPVSTKPRLALGLIVGLLLGALIAFLVGKLDSSVYGVQSTETSGRLPVLAEIPHVSTSRRRRFEVLTQLSPLSGVADAYRGLRTSIGLMWLANESETGRTEPRTLIVASPGPNEGKSTTSANLAAAYAEMGKSVIVVDLDFRRQRLHKFLGANAEPHLANIGTLSEPRVDLDSITQSTSIPGVRFIGSAAPDSTPAEAAVAGRAAILAAQGSCDIVIIDTPPLLLTNDTFDLLDFADAVLMLVRDGRTKTTALARASQQLRRLDAPVLGIALIGAVSSRPGYGYGYGYGYRYGYSYGGYGYGYGMRTNLDSAGANGTNGADHANGNGHHDVAEPVAVSLSDTPARSARRFGVRRASEPVVDLTEPAVPSLDSTPADRTTDDETTS